MHVVNKIKTKWDLAFIDLKPSDQAAHVQTAQMMATGWEPFSVFWKIDVTSIGDPDLRNGYYAVALRRLSQLTEEPDDNLKPLA